MERPGPLSPGERNRDNACREGESKQALHNQNTCIYAHMQTRGTVLFSNGRGAGGLAIFTSPVMASLLQESDDSKGESELPRRLWQLPSDYMEGEVVGMHVDGVLVFASIVVSAIGAFATLTTAAYTRKVRNSKWYFILLCQCGLGLGVSTVWAMHIVAQRSLFLSGGAESGGKQQLEMSFDLVTTTVSALIAWLLSTLALHVALGRKAADKRAASDGEASVRLPLASLLLAVSIGAMHYAGTLAARGPFVLHFDAGLLAV